MADYIDREELKKTLLSLDPAGFEQSVAGMVALMKIDEMPAEEVVAVKRGKWLEFAEKRPFGKKWIECSECKSVNGSDIKFNYCPNCGAKMDKE